MTQWSLADAVVQLAAVPLGAGAAAGNWIKITPRGRVECRDGRTFAFNPEKLVARFDNDETKLPIDFNHGTEILGAKGERVDAIGWIEQLEARDDGLYGHVEWLETGKAALAAKTQRYVSPTFSYDRDGNAQWLRSVALVTTPGLMKMPALASAQPQTEGDDMDLLSQLRASLSSGEDASVAEVMSEIQKLKTASLSAVDQNVRMLVSDLAKERGEMVALRAKDKADQAISEGAFPPYMRDWAVAFCAANPEGFDSFLSDVKRPHAHLFASPITKDHEAALRSERQVLAASSEMAGRIADQLGIPHDSLKD